MVPIPSPMRSSPGANAQTLGDPLTRVSRTPMPAMVMVKPARMRVRCARHLARRSAATDDTSSPTVAAVKITPVWMAS